jgi:murein DD-endopeptidase MepM/ murein hydrolase activator NlpD
LFKNFTEVSFLRHKKSNLKLWLLLTLSVIILIPAGWLSFIRFEGEAPEIDIQSDVSSLGAQQKLPVLIVDHKTGLRKVSVGLIKGDKEIELLEQEFPALDILTGGQTHQETIDIRVEPESMGITDGQATLRIAVWDFSWRNWLRGNKAFLEKNIIIDTQPPKIEVMTRAHNVNQGGAGLIVYRVSEACLRSGVQVGPNFFPGHSGYFKDPDILLAFFALSYRQGRGTEMYLVAADMAANETKAGFPHYIRNRKFKKDVINISDSFLNMKLPELSSKGLDDSRLTPIEKFLKINSEMRQANYGTLSEIGQKTDPEMHWEGNFLRLPNSAPRAGFADHREYRYQGQTIDHQVHLGVDLASIAQSPIPAANTGKVAFTGFVGIYGNTVVIDHGFGIFSIYAHLSGISCSQGDMVSHGDIIGRTGLTGLAGGDHLHFGIMLHNTFVNPIEWWDMHWIEDNVLSKLETVRTLH